MSGSAFGLQAGDRHTPFHLSQSGVHSHSRGRGPHSWPTREMKNIPFNSLEVKKQLSLALKIKYNSSYALPQTEAMPNFAVPWLQEQIHMYIHIYIYRCFCASSYQKHPSFNNHNIFCLFLKRSCAVYRVGWGTFF